MKNLFVLIAMLLFSASTYVVSAQTERDKKVIIEEVVYYFSDELDYAFYQSYI